jgi:hypothetical protein
MNLVESVNADPIKTFAPGAASGSARQLRDVISAFVQDKPLYPGLKLNPEKGEAFLSKSQAINYLDHGIKEISASVFAIRGNAHVSAYSSLNDAFNDLKLKINNDKGDLDPIQIKSLLDSVDVYSHEFALANTNFSQLQTILNKNSALTGDEIYILKNCLKSLELTKCVFKR